MAQALPRGYATHARTFTPSLPFSPFSLFASVTNKYPPKKGLDLQGNTYWELRRARGDDDPATARPRRLVQYPRGTHLSAVTVSPPWHQWLRHLRPHPPSLPEQHAEARRQRQVKALAAEADARWAAKPRVMMDGPRHEPPVPVLEGSRRRHRRRGGGLVGEDESGVQEENDDDAAGETRSGAIASAKDEQQQPARSPTKADREDPWKRHRPSGPGEEWQPQAWTPPGSSR